MKELDILKGQVEQNDKRQKVNNSGLSTQLVKTEAAMKTKLMDLEKSTRRMGNETLSVVNIKVDQIVSSQTNLENNVKKMHDEVDDKMHKINETEQIMAMVKAEIQAAVDNQVKLLISNNSEELKRYIQEKQYVKGIIGTNNMSYESWVINTHKAIKNIPDLIGEKFEETEQIIQKIQEQSEADEIKRDQVIIKL